MIDPGSFHHITGYIPADQLTWLTQTTNAINPLDCIGKRFVRIDLSGSDPHTCDLKKRLTLFGLHQCPLPVLKSFSLPMKVLISKSENLPSFCLLVGYSGYTALRYSLHSVQTRRDKKG